MKEIKVNELTDNLFETISKEWMLVTAGTKDKFNTMTANWGGAGFLWNRPVAFIFIRPERYTFDFIEQNDYLTLSFLGEEHKEVHKICGSKSVRNALVDKVSGLVQIGIQFLAFKSQPRLLKSDASVLGEQGR